jgi:hypothetical protein
MAHEAFNRMHAKTVVELGGWNGRLAASMLARPDVRFWTNYDLVKVPQACALPGYRLIVLDDYLWNRKTPVRADAFVACHTIEHLKAHELDKLIGCLDVKWVYLEAPLEDGPRDWTDYSGSHILEIGWDGVGEIMDAHGYDLVMSGLWHRGSA